jgi:hypothetical protein
MLGDGVSPASEREGGRRGAIWSIRVSIVCKGNSGSQDSIQADVGSNAPVVEYGAA